MARHGAVSKLLSNKYYFLFCKSSVQIWTLLFAFFLSIYSSIKPKPLHLCIAICIFMTDNNQKKGLVSIIAASSLGTLIEWYDFYIFGSLATIISTKFFPSGNPTAALLSTLATFAAGFVVRPFGALFFGRLGDLIGRKYTFLVPARLSVLKDT